MGFEDIGRVVVLIGAVVFAFFKITKVEINPLKWLGRTLSEAVTGEIAEKFNTLDQKFDELKADVAKIHDKQEENAAKDSRMRILRFGDEMLHGENHSKDHFDQILDDVNRYEVYCNTHPLFINNMTRMTVAQIKDEYAERLENNTFLK